MTYLKTFILAVIVFSIGLSIGLYFSDLRFGIAGSELSEITKELAESKTAFLFFETFKDSENFCTSFQPLLASASDNTFWLGQQLTALENAEGKDNPDVIELKKQYSVQNIELWLYAVNFKEKCPQADLHTILYFYTNEFGQCLDCKAQGFVLDELREKSSGRVWVFALEGNINLPLMQAVKKQFNVQIYPTLIINEKQKIEGIQSLQSLQAVLS